TVDYIITISVFTYVQFCSNLVLCWEYTPDSEIYLVWSQGTNDSGNPADDLFVSLDAQILGKQPLMPFWFKTYI
ncbi:MAG: hypothetical protein Q7J14_02110, partial [Candidatus Magasanikbacteria bacterium]|nr:hypothetical protein [Candidatus Magasanikbacteria bacterium]